MLVQCKGPKALRVLRDAFKDLNGDLSLRLMKTSIPATKAFGSTF